MVVQPFPSNRLWEEHPSLPQETGMSNVLIEQHGKVLSLRLNRPDRRNAMTGEMYTALSDAIAAAEKDSGTRAICFSGEGKGFCAGNDLGDFMKSPEMSDSSPVLRFLKTVSKTELPMVAAVHGAAVGIGTTLLLHCDLVYAAPSTKLALPFVNLGLVPEAGSSLLLPRIMGHARAAELILLGDTFGPDKGVAYGLVNEIVAEEDVFTHALGIAQKLAAKPPQALRLSRALLRRATEEEVQEAMDIEVTHFTTQLAGPETREAFTAFFEKRKPDFSTFT